MHVKNPIKSAVNLLKFKNECNKVSRNKYYYKIINCILNISEKQNIF